MYVGLAVKSYGSAADNNYWDAGDPKFVVSFCIPATADDLTASKPVVNASAGEIRDC